MLILKGPMLSNPASEGRRKVTCCGKKNYLEIQEETEQSLEAPSHRPLGGDQREA